MNTKNFIETNTNSLIFEYPFLMSSIKKVQPLKQNQNQRQPNYIADCPTSSPISNSEMLNQSKQFEEQNINDDSSIDFIDNQEIDMQTAEEIEFLQTSITQKLNDQYELLRQKLKQKSKQREQVLKKFRQMNTVQPLKQKILNQNYQLKEQDILKKDNVKNKPLDTKRIKNKIIKIIDQTQKSTQYLKRDKHQVGSKFNSKQNINLIYTFRYQNSQQNTQGPQFFKKNQHKQVQSITNIDHSDLIKQMSQELRKMEFKKVQDIAKGNFNFLKKK